MRRILYNTVQAILEGVEAPSMLHLMAFLRREEYRETIIDQVDNPEVLDFWREEFASTAGSRRQEMLGPLFTRLSPLLLKPMTRQVVGQPRTTLPIRALMDAGALILVDVSANDPQVGPANAEALGTLLVNAVWGAAASRVKGFYPITCALMIDEFHRFVTRDIEAMLAEARGFGLGVYMATQYYGQVPDWMQKAILANCWTKMVGAVQSPAEAALVAKLFPGIAPAQIQSLPKYTWIARVAANGAATDPFTLSTFPPLDPEKLRRAYVAAGGGRMPLPEDNGATPFDPFAGVSEMDAGERGAWQAWQRRMEGRDLEGRAAFLAELDASDFEAYRQLQRKRDLGAYLKLRADPAAVPDVHLKRDEAARLTREGIARVKRVRRLTDLKIGTPREVVMAMDLRLRNEMNQVESVFDDLLL
jgi:hypothetical protein